jgi:hypothetical protein
MRPEGNEDLARNLLFQRSLFEREVAINEKALKPARPSTATSLNYLEARRSAARFRRNEAVRSESNTKPPAEE